jgi:hypothetical protein
MANPKKVVIQRAKEKQGTDQPPSFNGTRILKKLKDETRGRIQRIMLGN